MERVAEQLKLIKARVEEKRKILAKIKRPSDEEIECRFHCFYLSSVQAHQAYHESLKDNVVYEEYKKQMRDQKK